MHLFAKNWIYTNLVFKRNVCIIWFAENNENKKT